jgi:diamine N-acetyltransferase
MNAEILPLRHADIPELVRLARAIWYAHYPNIISVEQIEYMLAQRYHADVIGGQLQSEGYWWHKLVLNDAMIAFCACELSGSQMKLDKLYVHHDLQRRGYGSEFLRFIENLARSEACQAVYLQVNKNNASAIHAYKRNGYTVRESVVFDIGNGFVMDDYVMAKTIARSEG